jgi:hypothetical protein
MAFVSEVSRRLFKCCLRPAVCTVIVSEYDKRPALLWV